MPKWMGCLSTKHPRFGFVVEVLTPKVWIGVLWRQGGCAVYILISTQLEKNLPKHDNSGW